MPRVKKTKTKKVLSKTKPKAKTIRKKTRKPVSKKTTKKAVKKVAKKTTRKKAVEKKKTATKKKVVKRAPAKKRTVKKVAKVKKSLSVKKSTNKQAEPISFGLLEQEVDEILDQFSQYQPQDLKNQVVDELVKLLPSDEAIVTSRQPKNYNIVVKNIRSRHEHSPYVLNLEEMLAQKQKRQQRKELLKRVERGYRSAPTSVEKEELIEEAPVVRPLPRFEVQPKPVAVSISKTEIKQQQNKVTLIRHRVWFKPVMTMAMIALAVILPLKGFTFYKELNTSKDKIINYSTQAFEDLQIAGQAITSQDSSDAQNNFNHAKMNFELAQNEISGLNEYFTAILSVIPKAGNYLTDAQRLTWAGEQIAEIGSDVTVTFNKLEKNNGQTITEKIEILQNDIENVLPKVNSVAEELAQVDPQILPADKQAQFEQALTQLNQLQTYLSEVTVLGDSLTDILGHNYKRRYLFVFQNNNELRATGGFMGSMALVDIHNGEIENIEMPGGGTYDMQGSLAQHLTAPYPLQLINSRWEFQDSNWFFDFPTSAQKIEWFYEKAGGPSVDGVIAMNATMMEKLLEQTQPIYLPEYNKTITAQNFIEETQKAVELEYDKEENKPKQFLADLAPVLIEQLFDQSKTDLAGVIGVMKQGLDEKEIQMYFNNPDIQEKISQYDWSGEIKDTSKDYLAVVNTNIAGGKTDGQMQQEILHTSQIQADGTIIDTVQITRKHNGDPQDYFSGVRNVDYMRIYVPQGSILLEASGFDAPSAELFDIPANYQVTDELLMQTETDKVIDAQSGTVIYNEHEKTVFGNWAQTDPQEESVITLKYQLPYKIKITEPTWMQKLFNKAQEQKFYSVFYQKQSGSQNTTVKSKIVLPENLQATWKYPQESQVIRDQVINEFELTQDQLSGVIIELKK